MWQLFVQPNWFDDPFQSQFLNGSIQFLDSFSLYVFKMNLSETKVTNNEKKTNGISFLVINILAALNGLECISMSNATIEWHVFFFFFLLYTHMEHSAKKEETNEIVLVCTCVFVSVFSRAIHDLFFFFFFHSIECVHLHYRFLHSIIIRFVDKQQWIEITSACTKLCIINQM